MSSSTPDLVQKIDNALAELRSEQSRLRDAKRALLGHKRPGRRVKRKPKTQTERVVHEMVAARYPGVKAHG